MEHRTNIVSAPLRLRWQRIAVPAFLALAMVTACGGSGSNKGSPGTGGGGGSGGSAGLDAGPDVSAPSDAGKDHGQPDVSQPDTGTDACQITNGGVEICDGIDNDCNGKIDDNIPAGDAGAHVGDPCNKCNSVWACPAFGSKPYCKGDGSPGTEVCDGIDNDCNGKIDDNIAPRACDVPSDPNFPGVPGSPGTYAYGGNSRCTQGTQVCFNGTWSACTGYTGPTTETCDKMDDDCDNTVDDIADTCTGCQGGVSVTDKKICSGGIPTCQLTQPLYYYLDADNDKRPQPSSNWVDANGNAVYGAVLESYSSGPRCSEPFALDGGSSEWLTSTYDWSTPAGRANDPNFKGIDCCDTEPLAFPGQTKYYQAGGGPQKHAAIPSECTAQNVKAWDFNCDGSYQHVAPDGSNTPWDQCADNCSATPGWDTLYGTGNPNHCWHDCGDTGGHWIYSNGGCGVAGHDDGWSPQCH